MLLRLADLVAYDPTDYRSGRRSQKATTKNVTGNAAYAGTNCGVPVLRGHPATTAQAEKYYCGNCADYTVLHRFHWHASMSNIGLNKNTYLSPCNSRLAETRLRLVHTKSEADRNCNRVDIELVHVRSLIC